MRLIKLVLDGFRGFSKRQTLRLDAPITALVGPNESGKSSLLLALQHLGSDSPFSTEEGKKDLSHRRKLDAQHEVIAGLFALGSEDRKLLKSIIGIENIRYFWLVKTADGKRSIRLDAAASVAHDSDAWQRVVTISEQLSKARRSPESASNEEFRRAVETAIKLLASELDAETLAELSKLLEKDKSGSIELAKATGQLRQLAANPDVFKGDLSHVRRELHARLPTIRLFDSDSQDLRPSYAILDNQRIFPRANSALRNLAAVGNLNLNEIGRLLKQGQRAEVLNRLVNATKTIDKWLLDRWPQSQLSVNLALDGQHLHIFVGTDGDLTHMLERSDGLRRYLALAAFAKVHEGPTANAIVLIDEIEQHLHYDAQAALVEQLSANAGSLQVIYTTHSLGALPNDLASSLRVVRSDKTEQTSVIESALWTDGKVGVLPLYVAMGASALAMSAVRNAVYVEGGSDCTLLPAIVNSAVPQRSLGFMTLPGVAQVATDLLGNLSNEASQIAFVLDGDADGDDYEKALLKAGYPKECIIRLPEGHVIEDLVDIKLYTSGVTRALAVNSVKAPEMPSSAIGSTNRPEKLKKWCLENGIEPPSKVAVAAEIVHVARLEGRGIVAPDHLDTVKRLSERLSSWFQKNSERRVNSK